MPDLAAPGWLWLLALAPALGWLGWRAGRAEGRPRRAAATALRVLALASLVVALAGPLRGEVTRHTDVVFALDVSRSVDRETAARALALVDRALAEKDPAARVGLVVFGADAAVETMLRRGGEPVGEISADVARDGTDIGRALEVAMGAFPAGGHRRIVLLSDGRENLGDARAAASVARAIGVEILAVPLERAAAREEVRVQGISAPSWVHVREPFDVALTVRSSAPARANLVILRDGAVVRDAEVDLEPGANAFTFVDRAARPGLHEYEAVVNAERDGVQENNRYRTFVRVRGAPRVLHAEGHPGAGSFAGAALREQGFAVETVPATALPATLHGLADYDLVVLDDVSGFDLSLAKMELLEDYVRDAGGGVVALGGERAYGAGGYYATPLERLLPVTMDVRTEIRIPSLAVGFVLDKSGSMSSEDRGATKLATAKTAAMAAIDLLNPLDRVAVLAFDAGHEWAVPPTEVGFRRAIAEQLRALEAGGGTDLFAALAEAHRVMRSEEAKSKHLIVLSDGITGDETGFESLGRRIAGDGITISTVAFGRDANRDLMSSLAAWGRGRFYYTEDPRNVPRIFSSETLVIARDLVVEGRIRPVPAYPGEMLDGIAAGALPPLLGYQRTFAKPAAQVLLATADGDPLLTAWRYGLGKSVAFASDLTGRWGREWVAWPELGRFVGQMARWTMRRRGTERMSPEFRWQGRRGEMEVDVLDRDDRFVNGLTLRATVVDPERRTTRITLEPVAPGRYRGEFAVPREGRYYVHLAGAGDGASVGPATFGLAVPYSSEFVETGADRERLADLAAATGGRVLGLSPASLPAILAPKPGAIGHRWRIWRPFLLAALILLLLEVAVRKVTLPERWRARLARRREARAAPEPGYEELIAAITAARERHLAALGAGAYHPLDDPAARARLYVAGARRGAG